MLIYAAPALAAELIFAQVGPGMRPSPAGIMTALSDAVNRNGGCIIGPVEIKDKNGNVIVTLRDGERFPQGCEK